MTTMGHPTVYMEKWGLPGYTVLHVLAQKHCGYSLETPYHSSSNEHQQAIFGAKIRKIILILN